MQMRAQGKSECDESHSESANHSAITRACQEEIRVLLAPGVSVRGWGEGGRKVRGEEGTVCAFHHFLRLTPFDFIWKMNQDHSISKICDVFFFSFFQFLMVPSFAPSVFEIEDLFFIS